MRYERTVVLPQGVKAGDRMPEPLVEAVRLADLVIDSDGFVVKNRFGQEGCKASPELLHIAHAGGGEDTSGGHLEHMGRTADLVASDTHKLLTFAALVQRDLAHFVGASGDAAVLRLAATQLRERAGHLADLAEALADRAVE